MRPTGVYATHRGSEYKVVARGDAGDGFEYVGLDLEPDRDAARFDVVVDSAAGKMAKVAPGDLDRYERVTTVGTVDGAEVTLFGSGPVVPCYTLAGPAWAKAHGFSGTQHDGWWGDVPLAEITDIRSTVEDLLAPIPGESG